MGEVEDNTKGAEHTLMDLLLHERAVVTINHEIDVLMRQIRDLQFRKTQHLTKIKHIKGLTTLARRILPEILAMIIEECVEDGWTRMPLTASHVCSEWRKATKIPVAWCHIYVNCDAKDPCGRTRFWLSNAQTSPLHITLDVTNNASHLTSIMDILLPHAAQWQTLTITSRLSCHANSILALCDCFIPNLESISISVREELDDSIDRDTPGLWVLNAPTRVPRLRALYFDQNVTPSPRLIPPRITIFSITLRHFHTALKTSIDELLTLLEGLPALQKFSVSLPYQQEREFDPALTESRSVSLLNLNTLILAGSPDLFRLLPHLATPALTSLHLRSSITSFGYPDVETGHNIRRYIESASPPLELLDFHDIDLSPSNFIACLGRLHHLKDLCLHESDISDSIIELFAQPDGLCPSIVRLDLRWCSQVTGRALVNLVHNRLQHSLDTEKLGGDLRSQPISQITLINCCFVKEEDLLQISETTVCRVTMRSGDYCRPYGCCQNGRYRRKLLQHGLLRGDGALRPPR